MRPALMTLLALLALCPSAMAGERISFDAHAPREEMIPIERYLSFLGVPPFNLALARLDLNEDRAPEQIIRQSDDYGRCPNGGCRFFILGTTPDGFVLLGSLFAHDVGPGATRKAGVKSLTAYRDPANDFEATSYAWNPKSARYERAADPVR